MDSTHERMTVEYLCLEGGMVYDPAHGVAGEIVDIWIAEGKVVSPPEPGFSGPTSIRRMNVNGCVVMPGGVDMHSHLVGSKVNAARRLLPELHGGQPAPPSIPQARGGTRGPVPSSFMTGYQYLGMGYTTALDAAVSPLLARHAQLEFEDTPCIDKGFLILAGDQPYALQAIRENNHAKLDGYLGWLIHVTGGYGLKLVNPGGNVAWKSGQHRQIADFETDLSGMGITPRDIVRALAASADRLGLPHPLHIHANQLGIPGNWETTLATMQALEGSRGHLTHIQFHSYGGSGEREDGFDTAVPKLVDYVNRHPQISVDVGQVMFGSTVSMTGDSPAGYYLAQLTGNKWWSHDIEQEGGCGVSPIQYREKSLVNSWQWAIGLEWYLLGTNPWQLAMTTDHPNGASFIAYPQIIRLLMDKAYRQEMLQRVHPTVRERSQLALLDREYSLNEIAIITRAAPARILGMTTKGHLGPGADADIVVYLPNDDREVMFRFPKHVFQRGELLLENGELRAISPGVLASSKPRFDPACQDDIRQWWQDHMTTKCPEMKVNP
jgi:formylmethanofuran dehydrogenase subunit A